MRLCRVALVVPLIGLALSFGGCVTLTPGQQVNLEEMRVFSKRVTDAYGKSPVYILVGGLNDRAGATMEAGGLMRFSTLRLDPGLNRDWLLAHELGHYVLAHRWTNGDTLSQTAPREMEANAEAVKILVVGLGVSEDVAYRRVHEALWGLERSVRSGTRALPRGHAPICEEIANLVARYPAYSEGSRLCVAQVGGR